MTGVTGRSILEHESSVQDSHTRWGTLSTRRIETGGTVETVSTILLCNPAQLTLCCFGVHEASRCSRPHLLRFGCGGEQGERPRTLAQHHTTSCDQATEKSAANNKLLTDGEASLLPSLRICCSVNDTTHHTCLPNTASRSELSPRLPPRWDTIWSWEPPHTSISSAGSKDLEPPTASWGCSGLKTVSSQNCECSPSPVSSVSPSPLSPLHHHHHHQHAMDPHL